MAANHIHFLTFIKNFILVLSNNLSLQEINLYFDHLYCLIAVL